MRNVAGNQKDLESFHASRPHNFKGFAQVVPNSPVAHGFIMCLHMGVPPPSPKTLRIHSASRAVLSR